jgi:hypothetical protein
LTELQKKLEILAMTGGFEPPTVCLEGRCSIQLSYVTIILFDPLFNLVAQARCEDIEKKLGFQY